MKDYSKTKEYIIKQLTSEVLDKELASKFIDILTWISNKEQEEENKKLTEAQLIEVGMRLHKKFQSNLELK